MSQVAEKLSRLWRFRNAALIAVIVPAALVAGCVPQAPPPPPPPPPQQPGVPVVRG